MSKKKNYSLVASLLTICMLFNIISGPVFAASSSASINSSMQNDNQSDGIILTKDAKVNDDGTIDITIEAYTNGSVTSHEGTTPTDIVLVLDLSGSMAERQTTYTTQYEAVNGGLYSSRGSYYYGFKGDKDYYVKDGEIYILVDKDGTDDNGFDYYYSDITNKYYYPNLKNLPQSERTNNYNIVQFYEGKTKQIQGNVKLDVLKEAVNKFIEETAIKNSSITNDEDKHRISIIKFAGPAYYNSVFGKKATAANALLSANIGNNKYNGNTYNYTQVVKDLTVVNSSTSSQLKSAVSSLTAGGATAIDCGIELAQHVFYDRDESEITNRNEVVIVVTDGEPTHGNTYSDSVAADAINFAYGLKTSGASIYTISVESNADASKLEVDDYEEGNAFMHYLSSNYPNATANVKTDEIIPNEGNISSGFYMTPSADMSLDMIFNKIIHHIDNPTILLGKEASVHDHISPYLDLTRNSSGDVSVQTALRKSDGTWEEPVDESGIEVTLENNNSTVWVKGFDFDKNFVSAEPRNNDFYGKKLIITINVKPDYAIIDANKAKIDDGWLETNNGKANVTNSNGVKVAEVNSPKIQMPKITYLVDGEEYDYYYLMSGESHSLIQEPTKTGYEFSGWDSNDVNITNDEFTMGNDDVIINGTFTAKKYKVTYKYSISNVPVTWPALDDYNQDNSHSYNSDVTVKPDLTLEGYVFKGWRMGNRNVGIIEGTNEDVISFVMPNEDVELLAHFEPKSGQIYSVEHWLEYINNIDDTQNVAEYTYDSKETIGTQTFARVYSGERQDITDAEVSLSWVNYKGFNPIIGTPSVTEGKVKADDRLVLKLYYSREKYKVTYDYEMPEVLDKPTVPGSGEFYYGEDVILQKAEPLQGYEFAGWKTEDSSVNTDAEDGEFKMPNKDVKFVGTYVPAEVEYEVRYYLQNIDDNDYTLVTPTEIEKAKTGDRVNAELKGFTGFKFNLEKSKPEGILCANGKINIEQETIDALEMYYDRMSYSVTYKWFEPQVDEVLDNDDVKLPSEQFYRYDEEFVIADTFKDFTESGVEYTFDGWYSHDIALSPSGDKSPYKMPAKNVVVLGRFNGIISETIPTVTYDEFISGDKPAPEPAIDEVSTNEYIVVDPNDGKWLHNENSLETMYENPVKLPMAEDRFLERPTREGYIFTGWKKYVDINSLPDTNGYPTDMANVKYIYIAQWLEACIVRYDLNGGTGADGIDYSEKVVPLGSQVVINPIPTYNGYDFTNWTIGSTNYSAGMVITVNEDIIIKANWSRNSNGGSSSKYTLTYESNGGTEYDKEIYSRGKMVGLDKVPVKEGYIFDGWHRDRNLEEDVSKVIMNSNITVYAGWVKEVPEDLNGDEHFAYIVGYPNGLVLPNNNITRAEVASIFFRLLKEDVRKEYLTSENVFSDVNEGQWYNTAVSTLTSLGIITGRNKDSFRPDDYITRAEFAVISARFDDFDSSIEYDFTDVKGHWAEKEIYEAAEYGWIKGYEDNTFRPNQSITRAEAMTLINRVLKREPENSNDLLEDMKKWPDNTANTWHYIAIQEATNSHTYVKKNEIHEKWIKITGSIDWTVYEK